MVSRTKYKIKIRITTKVKIKSRPINKMTFKQKRCKTEEKIIINLKKKTKKTLVYLSEFKTLRAD